jgi:hypothetical protein
MRRFELSGVSSGQAEYDAMVSNVTSNITEYLNRGFGTLLKDETLKAACIFEHVRWPSAASPQLDSYGDDQIKRLLTHYSTLYSYLGGDAEKALREWRRLKRYVMRTEALVSLSYRELYQRLCDQKSNKLNDQDFYSILLVQVLVDCIAVDTSICERGFSLMNNLKTARRSQMGNELLRILMTICSLGQEWSDRL